MCGICGILYGESIANVERYTLHRMTASLSHRGPDDDGLWIGKGVGLGHRRLAVIDPRTALQPMVHEATGTALTFNGEIYNFPELARDLEARGHRFRLRSDTEVLLHAFVQWGPAVVERLNGMFAFAVWDAPRRRLVLARDRLGQKPLYLARIRNRLLFASELKAIACHPDFESRLSPDSLRRYLVSEYVPDPHAILDGVTKLEPGHVAAVDQADLRVRARRYWDLPLPSRRDEPGAPATLDEAAEELTATLRRAASRRLISDVPLGVFLSGGLDSGTLVALLQREGAARGAAPLQTFCIGFDNPTFDESDWAARVATDYGTNHRVKKFTLSEMQALLPEVIGFLDEPFGDASILPTHLLSRFAREHVTVALSGDGGDELLAGYPTFQAEVLGGPLTRALWPGGLSLLRRAADRLPVSRDNISLDFRIKQFLRGVGYRDEGRHQIWLGSFSPTEARDLLTPDLRDALGPVDPLDEIARQVSQTPVSDPWDRLLVFYCRYYLAGDILVKTDRASMAVGLEVRAPFLDPEVVSLACRMSPRHRLRGVQTKAVLRRAAKRLLPRDLVARPKKGFGIPVAHWLRGPLRPLMERLLSPERLRAEGLFRPAPVRRLVDAHLAGALDARKPLWTLMAFQLWREQHLPGGAVAT